MNKMISKAALLMTVCGTILSGCAGTKDQERIANGGAETSTAADERPVTDQQVRAVAELQPTQGNQAQGTIYFVDEPQGTRVTGQITGLEPGDHGFHIHENGDCSAPDASSAGGHFNPTGAAHGGPRTSERHLGDLGNITANADGTAHVSEVIIPGLPFSGANAVLGKALLVHAEGDDLSSQPSGDSGNRVACGIIRERK